MTNIATKNGAVIIKDGMAAQDCSCCDECTFCVPTSVSVTISASNYVRQIHAARTFSSFFGASEYKKSLGFVLSPSSGTFELAQGPPPGGIYPGTSYSPYTWESASVSSPGLGKMRAEFFQDWSLPPAFIVKVPAVHYEKYVTIEWSQQGLAEYRFYSLSEMIADWPGYNGPPASLTRTRRFVGYIKFYFWCVSQGSQGRVYVAPLGIPGGHAAGSALPADCNFRYFSGVPAGGWLSPYDPPGTAFGFGYSTDYWESGYAASADVETGSPVVTLSSVDFSCE
jgi:hypothetical protein